ncbi:Uncharacterized protein TCM_013274 [Theobroma cacao]|uniref:Uncharacterized protein n=1 Tax=Theobroma cacao TaxID=3641 RepID=A0A061FWT5_THECC|nr:Uncharacterized protein TCM_013274 [Theobroma cacao]
MKRKEMTQKLSKRKERKKERKTMGEEKKRNKKFYSFLGTVLLHFEEGKESFLLQFLEEEKAKNFEVVSPLIRVKISYLRTKNKSTPNSSYSYCSGRVFVDQPIKGARFDTSNSLKLNTTLLLAMKNLFHPYKLIKFQ